MEPRAELKHTLAVLRATAGVDKVRAVGNGTGTLNSNGARCRVELPADAEGESEYEVIFMHCNEHRPNQVDAAPLVPGVLPCT
tara:strand:+ start:167 stop:415 length:249 start_codon:yes stop_codon:yes gene_type:complete